MGKSTTIRFLLGLIIGSVLVVSGSSRAAGGGVAGCYVKKSTWAETMQATRHAYGQWSRTDQDEGAGLRWGAWHEAGPFPAKKFTDAPVSEKNINIKAKKADGKRLWRRRTQYEDGVIYGLTPNIVGPTYLHRTITSPRPMRITVSLGSDDGIAVILNGKTVLSKNVARGVARDQDRLALNLKPGVNDLLLKVYNMRGGHGFYFAAQSLPALELWTQIEKDFPKESAWMSQDLGASQCLAWFDRPDTTLEERMIGRAVDGVGGASSSLRRRMEELAGSQKDPGDPAWLELYVQACVYRENLKALEKVDIEALAAAANDLAQTFPERYPTRHTQTLERFRERLAQYTKALDEGSEVDRDELVRFAEELTQWQRKTLLANPLLDFDRLLVIRRNLGGRARQAMSREIGMASLNSHNNTSITNAATSWDNEIVVLSDLRDDPEAATLYEPDGPKLITDVDLHWDAQKLMFSMPGAADRWHIFEIGADGRGMNRITPAELGDVDHFDSCYLADERIVFTSTASFQGLPCENGSRPMALLYQMDRERNTIRQLTFEQDSDWCPTMLNNGRVLYLRWEYSDTPHYFSRILFHMNPDGTGQMEYLGSNSYFPNAYFYARPIPNHPTQVVGIVGGHHGISRSGRLMLFDPAQGRHEADGAIQEIPGRHKTIEPIIRDQLVNGVWPQFLHPYPLSDKYFLVSAKLDADSLWGIYLVDVFDNMTLVAETEGAGLFEPIPLQARERPPVIADKVDLSQKEAVVFLTDVYRGQGLRGVPRGKVKQLRLFSYHFAHVKTGGHNSVGVESSWDIKRVLGTVPVEEDGSALFRVPANTPISIQPLDEQGRALQIMRSWFVGMPGEVVSCVGCHEPQNTSGPSVMTAAALKAPVAIEPWQGPVRPFAFNLEVEPVLDRYCVACHDGKKQGRPNFANRKPVGRFNQAYMALHPYVRRPGPESDIHVFQPMEYHAGTSELIQMLETGHHGVQLDREAWETVYTWIDLNTPYRGKWVPPIWRDLDQDQRRRELAKRYANIDDDPEQEYEAKVRLLAQRGPVKPAARRPLPVSVASEAGRTARRKLDLGDGASMELTLVPAGEFVMGDANGFANEQPRRRVQVEKPFWLGVCEVTNAQYALFDSEHDSRYIDQQWKDHTTPGYPANLPDQPVIRISWQEAMEFCCWLSARTGCRVTLPTEAQWEWACRAGTVTPWYYGAPDADFSLHANLADQSIQLLAVTGVNPRPVRNPDAFTDFTPRDMRFNDGQKIVGAVGQYQANPWGLKDMHGNVAEWTRTAYAPYPYIGDDGRNTLTDLRKRVARGGSWRDRPQRARSASRWAYEPYQRVFNVGFRVILEEADATQYVAVSGTEPSESVVQP